MGIVSSYFVKNSDADTSSKETAKEETKRDEAPKEEEKGNETPTPLCAKPPLVPNPAPTLRWRAKKRKRAKKNF